MSLSLVAAHLILDQFFQEAHPCVDAVIVRRSASVPPPCSSLEVSLAIALAHQWTPTISLTGIHPSRVKPSADHGVVNVLLRFVGHPALLFGNEWY